jgi:hypothetical protein
MYEVCLGGVELTGTVGQLDAPAAAVYVLVGHNAMQQQKLKQRDLNGFDVFHAVHAEYYYNAV